MLHPRIPFGLSARVHVASWGALCALLAALALGAAPAAAQQLGTIEGRVVDAELGSPLSVVSVTVTGTQRGALTDAQGHFTVTGVPAGDREVVAKRVGFGTAREVVHVSAGDVATLDLSLSQMPVLLSDVVVTATRQAQRLSETAATVGVISSDELDNAKTPHTADVMRSIPGVWASSTSGEGHMMSIRMPQSTDPVYLYLENGVPTRSTGFFNHNALYEVDVPQAERVEVLKGPATALYGSDAIGGVINVETRAPTQRPSAGVYLEGGQNGWARALLSASGTRGHDGVRADVNFTRTSGWREATGYDRQSTTLRWDHSFGSALLKTVFDASRIHQQTAGASALLRDDYLNDPTLNYTPISTRDVRAIRLSSAFQMPTSFGDVSLTPYLRWDYMSLLPNWSLTYDPTTYTTANTSQGFLAKVTTDLTPLRTRLMTGVDVDHSPGWHREHRVNAVRSGQVFTDYSLGDLLYDYDVTYLGVSPYVQAEATPVDRLHLSAGLRYDHMAFIYDSKLAPIQTGRWRRPADATVSYDHLSPKLGVTLDFGPALNLYGNYNIGFRAPSESQLFRQGSAANTVDLEPVLATSTEAGVRGQLLDRVGYSVALYRMVVDHDILSYIRPDGIRETQNAGETLHRGVEVGLGLNLTRELRADVSYSLAKHTYVEWRPNAGVDYAGNEQESAPNVLANVGLTYTPAFLRSGSASLEWSRMGSYWMDAENTHRYPGHDLVTLSVNAPLTPEVELIGRIDNLTDERYAETALYTQARGEEFAPGMPRTVYLGVQYRWENGGNGQ